MQSIKNIISRPDTDKYTNAPSLGHILIKNLIKAGDKTVLISGETGKELSAKDLLNKSIEITKALIAAGIKPGDVVSMVSENRFEFIFVLFGTIFLNCPMAPLNHSYGERELIHAFNLSKPKFIFTSGSTSKTVLSAVKLLSYVEKIILFDDDDEDYIDTPLTITHLRDFTKNVHKVKFEPKAVDILSTICLIMCSSGTTGLSYPIL